MDAIEIYKKHLPNLKRHSGHEWKALCPFHQEKTPSFYVNDQTGFYYCQGCGEGGGISKFLDKLGKEDERTEIVRHSYKESLEEINILQPISQIVIEQMHRNLINDKKRITYLIRERFISYYTIQRYLIGWDTLSGRYSIPLKTKSGRCINIKLHNSALEPKAIYFRKGSSMLYPVSSLQKNDIVICEGEFDCLALLSKGINAITNSSGSKTWNDSWSTLFFEKNVKICYDTDKAGRDGAESVFKKLENIANRVEIITLSDSEEKIDVTDYIKSGHDIFKVLKIIKR